VNILFFKTNTSIKDELREYIHDSDIHGNVYFGDTIEQVITILHAHPIDIVILELKSMADIRLLKYTYEHFPNVRIILTVERNIENVISTIRNSQFGILHKPFTLKALKEIIDKEGRRNNL
jgi:DNA-binding NtrC family response regulator